jgi:hypothetical protein
MIRALVSGVLFGDPVPRISQGGKPFVTGKLRADDGKGGSVFCSLVAFNDQADRLALLNAGAALSVSGKAEVKAWLSKTGDPQAGLSLIVDDLAVLKAKPRPRAQPSAPVPTPTFFERADYLQA